MAKHLPAQHGIVCRLPGERLGFFGWPTLVRLDDGTLMVASSGLRSQHICPWGKTVLNASASILDALLPVRNQGSMAHPNAELLGEPEARLIINVGRTLLNYLDAKLS